MTDAIARLDQLSRADWVRAFDKAVADRGTEHVYPDAARAKYPRNQKELDAWLADTSVEDGEYPSGRHFDCLYSTERTGQRERCIVGQVLYNLGVPDEDLESLPVMSVGALLAETNRPLDRKVVEFLSVAQTAQDTGSTWGEAAAQAYLAHPEIRDQAVVQY